MKREAGVGDGVGLVEILTALVPDKGARGIIWVIVALLAVAAGGVYGYTLLIANDDSRIDARVQAKVHPVKVKVYEDAAINKHIFEHIENSLPASQRHSIDQVRREGHNEMLEDERLDAVAKAKAKESGD